MKSLFKVQTLLLATAFIFSCKNDPADGNAATPSSPSDTTLASANPAEKQALPPGEILPVSGKTKAINSQFIALESGEKISLPAPGNDSVTTIFLVRHAELMKGKNSLAPAGQARSNYLATLMQSAGIFIVYVFDNATMQTGLPSAVASKSEFFTFTLSKPGDQEVFLKTLLKNYLGQRVLVVGTAEVVPSLVNQLAGKTVAAPIANDEFDNMYVAIGKDLGMAELKRMKY